MSLSSLPLDILLSLFRLLSTRDVIRAGMTCKFLYAAAQEHHVWLDQVRSCLRENPSLRLLSLSIDSLSTEDLYRFAILQAKLHIRWDQPPNPKEEFTHLASLDLDGAGCLLPGGNVALWAIDHRGDIELYRTDPQVRSQSMGPFWTGSVDHEWAMGGLVQMTSPQPVIAYSKRAGVLLVTVDEHGGITPVVSLTLPGGNLFTHFHGQERVVCFLTHDIRNGQDDFVVVAHLDYPTTTLMMAFPDVWEPSASLRGFDICLPCPDLLAVFDGDEIRAYRLPDFSTLGPGMHVFEDGPIYSLNSPPKEVNETLHASSAFRFVDQVYDPFSASTFNLHLKDVWTGIIFTFTIDLLSPGHQAAPALHRPDVAPVGMPDITRSLIPPAKGLSYEVNIIEQAPVVSVLPLADIGRENKRGVLKFYLPREVVDDVLNRVPVYVDVDEGSGRVLVKRYFGDAGKLFVAELV